MSTLISWGNSEGTKGRCDAKCHGAKDPKCACMCGGRYHGKGVDSPALFEAVKDYGHEVLEAANAKAKELGLELKYADLQEVFDSGGFGSAPSPPVEAGSGGGAV